MFEKVEVFKQRAPAGLQKTAPGTFRSGLTVTTTNFKDRQVLHGSTCLFLYALFVMFIFPITPISV